MLAALSYRDCKVCGKGLRKNRRIAYCSRCLQAVRCPICERITVGKMGRGVWCFGCRVALRVAFAAADRLRARGVVRPPAHELPGLLEKYERRAAATLPLFEEEVNRVGT